MHLSLNLLTYRNITWWWFHSYKVIYLWSLWLAILENASGPGPITCFARLFALKRPVSAYSPLGLGHLSPFVIIFGVICAGLNPLFDPLTFLSSLVVAPVSFSTRLCFHCGLLRAQSWWRLGVSRKLLYLFYPMSIQK